MQAYGHQPGFVVTLLAPPPLAELNEIIGVEHVEALSDIRFRIMHSLESNTSAILLALAAERGWQPQQLTPIKGSIEDIYNRITENESA
jgi:hypothetical protein